MSALGHETADYIIYFICLLLGNISDYLLIFNLILETIDIKFIIS